MIEMLITMTLFGLVMSSLVVALNSGVVSWRSVRANQSRQAATDRAFEQIRLDFQHLTMIQEDVPPLVETTEDSGGERLRFTILGGRRAQSNGTGSSWAEVEYRVVVDEATQSSNLVRELRPKVGPSSIEGAEVEETILERVASVHFDYLGPNGTVPLWEDENALPAGIKVLVRFESGRTQWHVVTAPAGYLQALAGL